MTNVQRFSCFDKVSISLAYISPNDNSRGDRITGDSSAKERESLADELGFGARIPMDGSLRNTPPAFRMNPGYINILISYYNISSTWSLNVSEPQASGKTVPAIANTQEDIAS